MLLSAKKLSIGYPDRVVCKDLNFSVNKGDFLSIIGENGTGKSTLIKTILGLNKVLKGELAFGDNLIKSHIGYLPQVSESQKDFPATVWEVVTSGFVGNMGFRLFFSKAEKERAISVMTDLGIIELKKKSFKELSGGQQQRVLLARALVATNGLLILDEPTNALDAKFTRSFYSLLKKLNKEGLTIIMVSHNIDKVLEMSSHIVAIRKGGNFYGTREEYLKENEGGSL